MDDSLTCAFTSFLFACPSVALAPWDTERGWRSDVFLRVFGRCPSFCGVGM